MNLVLVTPTQCRGDDNYVHLAQKNRLAGIFSELLPEARQRLVEFGAPLLLTEAEGRLALAERKIRAFEEKYGATLAQLCRTGLPDSASIEMHEDFIEWC